MEENNVFTGKTTDAAIEEGLAALGLKREEAEIEVIEEGKKKLFGSVKAKVKITKKKTGIARAADFIDKLFEILKISAVSEIVGEGENLKIDINTTNSAKVIGKHGDMLDAIQTLAGAVANIGSDEYKKVVVDCENYREQREQALKELAEKLAKKAVEKGRKMILEPMNPYERRIIHSALSDNTEVKTISEGKEPNRYVAVIPNNAKPNDRGLKFGDRGERREHGGDRRLNDRKHNGDRGGRGRGDRRPSGGGEVKRGKKEIHFGTFLGNSGAKPAEEEKPEE